MTNKTKALGTPPSSVNWMAVGFTVLFEVALGGSFVAGLPSHPWLGVLVVLAIIDVIVWRCGGFVTDGR